MSVRGTTVLGVLGAAVVAGTGTAALAAGQAGTIKDLEGREIQVVRDPPAQAQVQQAIEHYRRFLELRSGNEAMRAEAMRRLGDLQLELDEAERATGDAVPGALERNEAVALYEGLLAAYPDYARNDAVMYQLARAHEAGGELDKALEVLDRLVLEYPGSPRVTEAQFRRGEILFSAGRYRPAEAAYAAVVAANPDDGFHEQGLYKHAWSLFKQGRGEESASSFLRLLDRVLVQDDMLRGRESLSRAERELSGDALNAMAIAFLDLDGPQSLDTLLAQRGDPLYAHLLYEALGDLYLDKERYQDAALAYEAFARRRPDDRFAPSLQMHAIEAYQKGGFASLVLQGKQDFVERYAFGAAFWRQRSVADAPEVAAQLKSNQANLAAHYHAQAQGSARPEDYSAAIRWYRAMLDSFPQDAEAPATNYLLAEVLFESGRLAEAAREYERTAYEYTSHEQSSAAGYGALVAYQKHEPALSGEPRAAWHRQGIESALMFASRFPAHPQVAQVLTKADEDLFGLNEFDRVIEVSTQILALDPPPLPAQRRTAATLLAHALFDRGRYAQAESAYLRVQGYLIGQDPEQHAIEERIAASIYKQAEAKQAAGDAAGAVDDFLRIGTLAPMAQIGANAEYDAAGILVQDQQWQRATQVLDAFRRRHPQHELVPEATRLLALTYLEAGAAGSAAVEFERIAARGEEPEEIRREALWQAAELYGSTGSSAQAARLYAAYVQQYPMPLDPAMEARQKLADMAQAQHDAEALARWNEQIVGADGAAGAARTERSRYLAAKATLAIAAPQVERFNAIRLVAPLEQTLARKRSAMETVLAVYGQALDYDVAQVTTAATFGMAELYRQLAVDLLASERPRDLDADALEQYDVLLEEQAFPFEEKAIELHEANARRAREGLYDEWVQRSFGVLAQLEPARYAKAEMSEEYVHTLR